MAQIISFLQGVGGFLFVFGIVVLVHELGHFLAAKATGVYAPRFSVGFGPGLHKRWGETQYQLGVIPLGGYVRMASREDEATAFLEGGSETSAERDSNSGRKPKDWDPDAMIPFGPKPVPEHRWFESKTLPQRLTIMLAGVTMNAILTVLVLFGMALVQGRTTVASKRVGGVRDVPAAAALRSQLQPGDSILTIQGVALTNWNSVIRQIIEAEGDTVRFETSRGPVAIAAGAPRTRAREALALSLEYYVAPIISPRASSAASRAGLQLRDSVIAVDGSPVRSFFELVERVSANPDRDLAFTVARGSQILQLTVRPEATAARDPATGEDRQVGRIGADTGHDPITRERIGVAAAFTLSLQQTGELAVSILQTLKGLMQRTVSIKELGGPLMIAEESGKAAQRGIGDLFYLLALLSINLAILNLLPIPVLDGGQILILLAESVKGSPFSPRARQYILGSGVVLVLLLMLVVTYNDILRIIRS